MHHQQKTVISLRTTDTIREEAAGWLVKLDNRLDSGNLSPDDLIGLREWLAQNPLHGKILKRQAAIWSDMDVFVKSSYGEECQAKTGSRRNIFTAGMARGIRAFACSFLLIVAVWQWAPLNKGEDNHFYSTNVGSQRIEALSDGSTAHLNTDSLVEIRFSEKERAVVLLRGEAMFDVVHDAERSFVVYAEGHSVKAVGTKFVVRLTSDRILVAVAEGQVQLSSSPEHQEQELEPAELADKVVQEVILLSQGQEAELGVRKLETPVLNEVDRDEFRRKFSWTNGRLIFLDEKLETIITEVSRYTPVRVVIADPELRELRLSGRFQIGDTEALLDAIEISGNDIQISRNSSGNMIYIVRKI